MQEQIRSVENEDNKPANLVGIVMQSTKKLAYSL